ncbi:MAG: TDT family transporter [Solibacillus sp.]
MRQLIKQIPIPMSGLMLALFSITNLATIFEQQFLSELFFYLGVITWGLLTAKIIFAWSTVKQDLQNPVVASVAPTFTMGIMVFASILAQFSVFAYVVWTAAFIIQLALIAYFIQRFMWKKQLTLSAIYPSWFILFVGLGIVPVTAGTVFPMISQVIFYVVFISYVMLLPVVIVRLRQQTLEEGVKPLITIVAAPGSLCLVGYLQITTHLNSTFVVGLFVLSQILYVVAVSKLPKLVALPFYPSFAAFTFPLVISATAAARMAELTDYMLLQALANAEFVIALVIVLYVVVRYLIFLKKIVMPQVRFVAKYHH